MAIPNSPTWSDQTELDPFIDYNIPKPNFLITSGVQARSLGPDKINNLRSTNNRNYWMVHQEGDQVLIKCFKDGVWCQDTFLFNEIALIEEISLAFDTKRNPVVFYKLLSGDLRLYRVSKSTGLGDVVSLGSGEKPLVVFDTPSVPDLDGSGVILFYTKNILLLMREEASNYNTELATPGIGRKIEVLDHGLSTANKFQISTRRLVGSSLAYPNSLTFTRASTAFNFSMVSLPADTPALEPFQISPYVFTDVDNLYPDTPFNPNMEKWTYLESLTNIKQFASDYGWDYEDLCATYEPLQSGLEHPTLSYKTDEGRPIIIFQNATHGNEKHSLPGIMEYLKQVMTSDREDMIWLRNNVAFMVMCIQNPNGWNLDRRRNGTDESSVYTGVNLNRNWDYFWDYAADPDKGTHPFSEIENRNFRNWLERDDRISDGVIFIDFHSWWSRSIYGLLTDHNFNHGMKIQTMERSIWRYGNYLMKNRDWTGYTLNGGIDNMVLSERSSTRKPYAPYWGQQRMQKYRGYCCQLEVPQGDESQAVNAQVILDLLTGMSLAVRDYLSEEKIGIKVDKEVLPTDILNRNSLFADWSTTYNRPQYFRSEGVVLVNNDNRADIHRPLSAAWPKSQFDTAYCTYIHPLDETKSFFVVGGGEIEGNVETTAVYLEMLVAEEPPEVGSDQYGIYKAKRPQIKIDSLPEPIKAGSMVYCNGYIYHFMGHMGNQGYNRNIYRLPVTTATDNVAEEMDAKQWELVKQSSYYTLGLQRHRTIALGTDIFIIGGRDSDDYTRDIVKFDTLTNTETLVGQVGYKNGWFGIERIGITNKFIYFGGWNGISTKDDCFIIDLSDHDAPVIDRVASMPDSRRSFTWGLDQEDNILYVSSGETAENTYTTDILAYDVTNDVWESLSQTEDGGDGEYSYSKELDDEEEAFDVADITVTKAASTYNPYTRTLNTIGGEINDGTGSAPTITFFEFNTEERALSARKVNDITWGLVKPSTSYAISDGHLSTVVASVRNEMQWIDEDELKINPYVRSLNYVGPTWSQTTRWRHKYLVAPRLEDVAVPCYGTEPVISNSKIYSYLRLYGEGTKVSSQGLQVIDNKLLTPRMVPETGMAEEKAVYTIDDEELEIRGAYFSPLNERYNETLKVAKFIGADYTINLLHVYDSTAGTGMIRIEVENNSTSAIINTYDITNFVTNYDLYTNMYKRDVINFRIVNKSFAEIELWIYGEKTVVTIPEIGYFFSCTTVEANYDPNSRVGIGFYLEGVDV